MGDPYELGRVAAVHAMGDCWAMGAEPQAALAHVVLPYSHEGIMEATLETVLAGACTALREGGCALAGGHTSESDGELGVGFSIHGAVQAEKFVCTLALIAWFALVMSLWVDRGKSSKPRVFDFVVVGGAELCESPTFDQGITSS